MPTQIARRTREHEGREDPEVRALMNAACSGLYEHRLVTRPLVPKAKVGGRCAVAVFVFFALPALILPLRMALAADDPRPSTYKPAASSGDKPSAPSGDGSRIWDAAGFVRSDARRSAGRFLVATVREKPADRRKAALAMKRSQRDAFAAARACVAQSAAGGVALHSQGVGGPSAGLMMGLAIVDHFDAADVTRGRRIAGTGTLSATGKVGPVGAVAKKAKAAQRAGAELFFVPSAQRAEAVKAAGAVKVVGVRHLSDAVRTLVGTGCRG